MYRRLYRQEGGGLGGLNPYDYMRQEVDKYVQDYNQSNQGEVAAKVMPRPVPQVGIGQRIKTGISNLVPDTVKNYAAIPINLFNSLGGGNTGYMSPEMIEATRQAALNAIERTGQDTNVSMDSSDYYGTKGFGFGEGELDAGTLGGYPKIFTDAGSGAGSAAVTYGGATVNKNPGTGEISFTPGSGDYDMSDNNPIWLGGIPGNLGLSDKNPMNVPMESFIDPAFTAAKEYGDIEAQAEANRLRQPINPLDYQNEFNFRRKYLSDYIDSSQDKFGDEGKLSSYAFIPEVSPMYNATQETGLSYDPQRYSEYQKASDAADRAWGYRYNPEQNTTVTTQPTGFQNQQQGLPSLMKIVNEQRNPTPVTPSNATGFNSKADAMADLRSKYSNVGLVAMPTQNADGSWSYQPPYNLDSPPPKPLGLLNPGMAL